MSQVEQNPPSKKAALATLALLFGLSGLCGAVIMAALSVINIGGYCATGGPYLTSTPCPPGASLILSLGIPAMFLLGFGYIMAKPAPWPATIGYLWPVLFVGMAVAFLIGALNAPGGIGWVSILTGIVMLLIGIVPAIIFKNPGKTKLKADFPHLSQAAALILGVSGGILAFWLAG